ncbi:MAG: hypothetical protein ACQSGP_28485 [Frankia sp.]
MTVDAPGWSPRLVGTRESWHAVGEHVLAVARFQSVGRIGLAVAPGGFTTPPFGPRGRTVAVVGTDLVVTEQGSAPTRTPITTLRAAAVAAGVEPGTPVTAYPATTPGDLDAALVVDVEAAKILAGWYTLGDGALRALEAERVDGGRSPITLWPEHFDAALRADGVNYGVSLGDAAVPEPYLYVGPDTVPDGADGFWNQTFGAARTWADVSSAAEAVAFFREGRRRAHPGG